MLVELRMREAASDLEAFESSRAEDAAIEFQVLLVGSMLDGTGCFFPRTGGSDDWLAARRWKSRHRRAVDCPRKDRPNAAVGRSIGHGGSVQLAHFAWSAGCRSSPLGCSRSTAVEHLCLCLLLVL